MAMAMAMVMVMVTVICLTMHLVAPLMSLENFPLGLHRTILNIITTTTTAYHNTISFPNLSIHRWAPVSSSPTPWSIAIAIAFTRVSYHVEHSMDLVEVLKVPKGHTAQLVAEDVLAY